MAGLKERTPAPNLELRAYPALDHRECSPQAALSPAELGEALQIKGWDPCTGSGAPPYFQFCIQPCFPAHCLPGM